MVTQDFFKEGFYHVYNRSGRKKMFLDPNDYKRFLDFIRAARSKNKKVNLISYSLNPNHFHILLRQNKEKGIAELIRSLCARYSAYYKRKYKLAGSLFHGPYSSILVEKEKYLLYLSAYINANTEVHKAHTAKNWIWSSYSEYIFAEGEGLCDTDPVLNCFTGRSDYRQYVEYVGRTASGRKDELKEYFLEKIIL